MNKHQQHLLNLLKEIDAFCKKHGITYYCAGGTVIGAARHKGFIPWDDDIDIYMTRAEFKKFADAFVEDPIPDRCIEYYDREFQHHSLVNRYHETTSTMLCHYHITGYACAGTLIDVFILDPIPDDINDRHEYIAKLWMLADLTTPVLSYSHRLPVKYLDIYEEYEKRIKAEGIPALVKELSGELFRYSEEECSDYCLRWGSIPLIYPIEAIGKPVYLPFEDMEVPVPQDWYKYLVVHYGCDWVQVPYVETRREHTNILRDDVPYTFFYEKRDELFTQKELMDIHFARKSAYVALSKSERSFESWMMQFKERMCKAEIDANKEKFNNTYEIYEPYLRDQTSYSFMGERMHHGRQYRWFFPYIININDDELEKLLECLLSSGNVRLCEKIVQIHEQVEHQSESIMRIKEKINSMNEAAALYYKAEYKECLEKISSQENADDYPWFWNYRILSEAQVGLSAERADELKTLCNDSISKNFSSNERDALLKAHGDYLWNIGKKESASVVYAELMKTCRNGMFYNDIKDKDVEVPAIPLEKLTVYTGNKITSLQDEMMFEIIDICERNNINYTLGTGLASRITNIGNSGYNYSNREIWMDADSAKLFIKSTEKELPTGRKLSSWMNDRRVNDLCFIYSDENSFFCDFRSMKRWVGTGIHVKIRILRNEKTEKKFRRKAYYNEFLINMLQVEKSELCRLKSKKKKMLRRLLPIVISGNNGNKICRKFFMESLNEELSKGGDYYYYINIPGIRPRKITVKRSDYEKYETLNWNGKSVRVPASSKEYVGSTEDSGNIEHMESLYIYINTEKSWEDIMPFIDIKAYESLNLELYGERRRTAFRLEKKVRDIWNQILALDETI